ncbi:MAG TPA: AAA family ATPase [Burkholderiales bacterium]|nr:AAA family ATPase [Burkholderiales bacterium]
MYRAHFGLREPPFGLTPDTSFVFACTAHQQALNTLLVAAKSGEGFMKITGEVGAGKTLLCRRFLASLGESFVSAYILNPYLDPRSLLLALADELRTPLQKDADMHQLLKSLTLALLRFARQGKQVVICLDEAQAMPQESLEALRLLTNLETEKRKLVQVVLFGQPELDEKLAHPSVRQLRQRITFHCRLDGLDRSELDHYLVHRLSVAGYHGSRIFTRRAVRLMHRLSGGIPRLVNILAHKSLLLTYGEGGHEVVPRHVRIAATDTPAAKNGIEPWWWLAFAMLLVSLSGIGWTFLQ